MIWILRWLLILFGWIIAGAIAGVFLFVFFGALGGSSLNVTQLSMNGLRDGAFMGLVWGPGGGIVFCFIWKHRLSKNASIED
jgi:hypothetical protein